MTEHDHRVCPSCGEPADDHRFCDGARAHLEPSSAPATHAGVQASPARTATRLAAGALADGDPAAQARLAVLRLEQALAAASRWRSDRAGAAVPATAEVGEGLSLTSGETTKAPGENVAVPIRLDENVAVPIRLDEPVGEVGQQGREVARFEELLTVLPATDRERAAEAASTCGASEGETTIEAPANAASPTAAPFAAIANLPISAEEYLSGVTEPPPAIEPASEIALAGTRAIAIPAGGISTAESPAIAIPAGGATHVEAQLPREAFGFERAAALGSIDDAETSSVPAPVADDHLGGDSALSPQRASHGKWLTALCLAALVAVLIVLTGRTPRR